MGVIKLKSCNGTVLSVDVEAAKLSITLKTMLDDLGYGEDDEEEPIPLQVVDDIILEHVIKWVTHHKDDPPYEEDVSPEKISDNIPDWDKNFLKVDRRLLFGITLAANYLNIKLLLDITCKTVANMIKGMTPDEIYRNFKTRRDGAEGEEAAAAAAAENVVAMES